MRGIADLEAALKLEPNHMPTKERYALALRRLGYYEKALGVTEEITTFKEYVPVYCFPSVHRPNVRVARRNSVKRSCLVCTENEKSLGKPNP